ncbi:MAG: zf-HC2 domain-containing protein [Bacillota bacterium]
MNSCSKIQADISAFLDGELTSAEKKQVEAHLASCEVCSQELKNIEKTIYILHSLNFVEPPENFGLELEKKLIKISRQKPPASRWKTRSWFSLGAVAAVLVLIVVSINSFLTGGPSKVAFDTFSPPPKQAVLKGSVVPQEQQEKVELPADGDYLPLSQEPLVEKGAKIVGTAPDAAVGVLKSGSGDETEEVLLPRGKNDATVSQVKEGDTSDTVEAGDLDDEDLVAAGGMQVMSSFSEGQEGVDESPPEKKAAPALAGTVENEEQQSQLFVEGEVNQLQVLLEIIEGYLGEQELEMELTVDDNKTLVAIPVSFNLSDEIKAELELLIQQEEDKGGIKQLKDPPEGYTEIKTPILIIQLKEY